MTPRRFLPLVVALGVLAAACSGGGGAAPSSDSPVRAVNATTAPGLPTSVAELPVTDVAAFHTLMDSLRGTPVVVNAWASWCVPCQSEAPLLRTAAKAHPEIQFLGVDILDSRSGAETFLAVQGIPYPSLFDPPGAIRTDLGGIGQPVTVFFDSGGKAVATVDGELSQTSLDQNLAKIQPSS